MFDINFYMKIAGIKQKLMNKKQLDSAYVLEAYEAALSRKPVLYNFETTNHCNMICGFCPRTNLMTRELESMPPDVFTRVADQLEPHSEADWKCWETFATSKYNIGLDEMSENHFFLYIIPRVMVLHGYGEPLLDQNLPGYVRYLSAKGIPTYFSCNPANIDVDKTIEFFESGLDYIKYSIDSVNDLAHKEIRGNASNFTRAYDKILKILEIKESRKLKSQVVITMIDFGRENQLEDYAALERCFKDQDVYIYLKSQDQQWLTDNPRGTKSVHWSEFCQYPWTSMTINCNGQAVKCSDDYNAETILGDVRKESLEDIWNGEAYKRFRESHFVRASDLQCVKRCDMTLTGDLTTGTHLKKTTH